MVAVATPCMPAPVSAMTRGFLSPSLTQCVDKGRVRFRLLLSRHALDPGGHIAARRSEIAPDLSEVTRIRHFRMHECLARRNFREQPPVEAPAKPARPRR